MRIHFFTAPFFVSDGIFFIVGRGYPVSCLHIRQNRAKKIIFAFQNAERIDILHLRKRGIDTESFFVEHQFRRVAIDVDIGILEVGSVLSEQLLEVMDHFLALHCGVI